MTSNLNRLPATITARVVPFDRMTADQQVDHLFHAHGLTGPYFYAPGSETEDATDEQAREHLRGWSPEFRETWHREDHEEYPHGGSEWCRHEHTHD